MNEPLGTISYEHSVILGCPVGEKMPCNIPLPRQSHLGKYEGPDYRPSHGWRETFLCLRHARVFVCSPQNIHLEMQQRAPRQPVSSLWQIESVCAHENCGKPQTIYTAKMPDWSSIANRILKTNPKILCGDHDFVWREDLIHGTEFAHDSPTR